MCYLEYGMLHIILTLKPTCKSGIFIVNGVLLCVSQARQEKGRFEVSCAGGMGGLGVWVESANSVASRNPDNKARGY